MSLPEDPPVVSLKLVALRTRLGEYLLHEYILRTCFLDSKSAGLEERPAAVHMLLDTKIPRNDEVKFKGEPESLG